VSCANKVSRGNTAQAEVLDAKTVIGASMLSAFPGFGCTSMDYQVSLANSGRYILIKVLVPMTSAVGVRCGSDAVSLGLAKNVVRFLFDLRNSPNVQSVVDNYEFAHKEIAAFGFPASSRSAFLVRPDDKSHDFIDTAFFNSGFVTKMFTDEASAIAWLEQESPPSAKRRDWRDEFL
jgi:hypothetical protein